MYSIIVPVHRSKLLDYELISLKNCLSVFNKYTVILVMPNSYEHCDLSFFYGMANNISIEFFEDEYFSSIDGYNRLLVSSAFYGRFTRFKYILIHQLDAFVFRDELEDWCKLDYDYVGAPWIAGDFTSYFFSSFRHSIYANKSIFRKIFLRVGWFLMRKTKEDNFLVGNGGFSLRNVKSHFKATCWFESTKQKWQFNEDIFWSIYVPLIFLSFKVPDYRKAMRFSFDQKPELYYLKCGELPFGCHAWHRSDGPYIGNFEFWKKIIPISKSLIILVCTIFVLR